MSVLNVVRSLVAALFDAPGRPAGEAPPDARRLRAWRRVAAAQTALALLMLTGALIGLSWAQPPWVTAMLLGASVTLVGVRRPLDAWRCALIVALLLPGLGLVAASMVLLVVAALAPAAYLYAVAVAYDRSVLIGAWLATVVVVSQATWSLRSLSVWWQLSAGLLVVVLVPGVFVPTMAALLGHYVRASRLAAQALLDQERRSVAEHAALALLEERSRIARELHDVVAHHMSVIAIHAETARYRVPDPPPELLESFAVIRGSAVEALTEMRRLLALLRSADGSADTAPQPGLADLDGVVDKARASGLVIHVRTAGPARPLPPGVDLSAYRIGQEAISNVLRHAPGASVWLDIQYAQDAVRLRIRNGRPAGSIRPEGERTSGQGLLGMRERALMLGGTLSAGPTDDGGFLVEAVLPTAPPIPR